MRSPLINLVALASLVAFLAVGCASVASTGNTRGFSPASQPRQSKPDPGQLTEREKWSLARDAFAQAQREEGRKQNEAAVYYYEVALELLGSLDMASIETPTRQVLSFQRKVLRSYDHFLASIDKLPASASPVAVMEASAPSEGSAEPEREAVEEDDAADRELTAPPIRPNAPPLPEVPVAMNTQVAGQINFFMNKGRAVMLRWMERSSYVFPRLRPILAEEGLPEDVLFLAMIESGLNPKAYSYAHAAGVWQFIPGTARIYGLKVNSIYDERLHVEASTRAACRYLRKLYEEFGDWYLAFAAYNCGEMRVEREIRRSHTRDYFRLNRLPRQTRGYVPIYLAARAICKNPGQYGFPPLRPEVPFECERVWVEGAYRLEHIAQAAGHDPAVVAELNPEFKRGVTPTGMRVQVRLPRQPDIAFESRLSTMPKTVVNPTQTHRVRKGETLSTIARKYGTTVAAIRALPENRRVKSNQLRVGQQITIPVADVAPMAATNPPAPNTDSTNQSPAPVAVAQKQVSSGPDHEIVYTVHRGETLSKIGRQLGVSVEEICLQNRISDPDLIAPGRRLRIRVNSSAPATEQTAQEPPASDKPRTHTVQPGDTLWSIAQAYGLDVSTIMQLNRLRRSSKIYPGQELIVSQN